MTLFSVRWKYRSRICLIFSTLEIVLLAMRVHWAGISGSLGTLNYITKMSPPKPDYKAQGW
jgi:hypothetical protein